MSADETLDAVEEIRSLTKQQCLLSGMSAVVADIKKICNSEAVMYVAIASGLSALVLALAMDSFLIPVLFLLSIGMAIIYNLGTNFVAGEISFITQALAAVLQLAVFWQVWKRDVQMVKIEMGRKLITGWFNNWPISLYRETVL